MMIVQTVELIDALLHESHSKRIGIKNCCNLHLDL